MEQTQTCDPWLHKTGWDPAASPTAEIWTCCMQIRCGSHLLPLHFTVPFRDVHGNSDVRVCRACRCSALRCVPFAASWASCPRGASGACGEVLPIIEDRLQQLGTLETQHDFSNPFAA